MDIYFIAEVQGDLGFIDNQGSLTFGLGSKLIWNPSRSDIIEFWIVASGKGEVREEIKDIFEEAIPQTTQEYISIQPQFAFRKRFRLPNFIEIDSSEGYILDTQYGNQTGILTTYYCISFDEIENELALFLGAKFHLGTIPGLPPGISISGDIISAMKTILEPPDLEYKLNAGPEIILEKVLVEHNEYNEQVEVGMKIYLSFSAHNLEEVPCMVLILFQFKGAQKLKDFNNAYRTEDGFVGIVDYFKPASNETSHDDFVLFMPYKELHLASGKHDIEFIVDFRTRSDSNLLGSGDGNYFSITMP